MLVALVSYGMMATGASALPVRPPVSVTGMLVRTEPVAIRPKKTNVTVKLVELPESADEQRTQLVQRLDAESDECDVLGMDVIWTAEFAEAGWIKPWEGERQSADDAPERRGWIARASGGMRVRSSVDLMRARRIEFAGLPGSISGAFPRFSAFATSITDPPPIARFPAAMSAFISRPAVTLTAPSACTSLPVPT
mgnify:CR=1 FL=1